eukprot:153135-Prymnesium_polylepis.1
MPHRISGGPHKKYSACTLAAVTHTEYADRMYTTYRPSPTDSTFSWSFAVRTSAMPVRVDCSALCRLTTVGCGLHRHDRHRHWCKGYGSPGTGG